MLDKTGCDKTSFFHVALDVECWTKTEHDKANSFDTALDDKCWPRQGVTRPVSLMWLWMQNVGQNRV